MAVPTTAESKLTVASDSAGPRADVIPSLDGLRAISIILVLAGHAIKTGPHSFAFRAVFLHAPLGVNVFFIISGFLITTLLLKERSEFGNISLRLFYVRRALRILPAFYLFVGCVALLSVFGVVLVPAWFWLYVLTYTVNFAPFGFWVLGHLWSLSVEEQFYLLWPWVVKVARPRTWTVVAIFAVCASPLTHAVHHLSGIDFPEYVFPFVCGPIAMGCLLAMKSDVVRNFVVSSKLVSSGWSVLLVLFFVAIFDAVPNRFGAPTVFLGILTNSLLTLCVARFVFVPTGLISFVLNSAPAVFIGKLSYSLYLWQQLFLNPGTSPAIPAPFPLNFVLIFAAASASYWGLEARFLKVRKKFRAGRSRELCN